MRARDIEKYLHEENSEKRADVVLTDGERFTCRVENSPSKFDGDCPLVCFDVRRVKNDREEKPQFGFESGGFWRVEPKMVKRISWWKMSKNRIKGKNLKDNKKVKNGGEEEGSKKEDSKKKISKKTSKK